MNKVSFKRKRNVYGVLAKSKFGGGWGGDYNHVSEHNHVQFATFPGHGVPILQLTAI
jgi:hypothetical protein